MGRIPLQKQYDDAEKALFESVQKADETNDSFLARIDVLWSKLLSPQTDHWAASSIHHPTWIRPQSRGKEDGNPGQWSRELRQPFNAVCDRSHPPFGCQFLSRNDWSEERSKRQGVWPKYLACMWWRWWRNRGSLLCSSDEWTEDNLVDSLREQGDDDACLIADFEETAVEMLQDDANLATAYSAYQEARARLSEKFRNRGFWSKFQ